MNSPFWATPPGASISSSRQMIPVGAGSLPTAPERHRLRLLHDPHPTRAVRSSSILPSMQMRHPVRRRADHGCTGHCLHNDCCHLPGQLVLNPITPAQTSTRTLTPTDSKPVDAFACLQVARDATEHHANLLFYPAKYPPATHAHAKRLPFCAPPASPLHSSRIQYPYVHRISGLLHIRVKRLKGEAT